MGSLESRTHRLEQDLWDVEPLGANLQLVPVRQLHTTHQLSTVVNELMWELQLAYCTADTGRLQSLDLPLCNQWCICPGMTVHGS